MTRLIVFHWFKAMTTGIVPAFVDFVMNFASAELAEDNLLTRMRDKNKIMTFYGDDTWLRLFPNHFKRYDGTTSFIVTDFYEVQYSQYTLSYKHVANSFL